MSWLLLWMYPILFVAGMVFGIGLGWTGVAFGSAALGIATAFPHPFKSIAGALHAAVLALGLVPLVVHDLWDAFSVWKECHSVLPETPITKSPIHLRIEHERLGRSPFRHNDAFSPHVLNLLLGGTASVEESSIEKISDPNGYASDGYFRFELAPITDYRCKSADKAQSINISDNKYPNEWEKKLIALGTHSCITKTPIKASNATHLLIYREDNTRTSDKLVIHRKLLYTTSDRKLIGDVQSVANLRHGNAKGGGVQYNSCYRQKSHAALIEMVSPKFQSIKQQNPTEPIGSEKEGVHGGIFNQ